VGKIVSRLKAITGGDSVTVNRKNRKQISVRLPIKILMLTNDFLVLPDNSGAVHIRTIPLKFTKSFAGIEDASLGTALKDEYAGILNWALEGVRSLLAANGRFTLPESSQDELDQLKMESAPLQDFVDECCDLDSRLGCQSRSLYQIYLSWHEQAHSEEKPLEENVFSKELKKTVHSITKARLKAAGDRWYGKYTIVETLHDNTKKRAPIWLGIAPKAALRSTQTAAAPVLGISNFPLPLPVVNSMVN
jgi:putative DNA primase/helicase